MKYDSQVSSVQQALSTSPNNLVILPPDASVDRLAAGLALFLSLQQAGKEVAIASGSIIKVSHTNLFGVGDIKNTLPEGKGGNFIISLGGVIDPNTQKPTALEKLEWFPNGNDLKLVFSSAAGHKFDPTHVTPSREGGGFGLIFIIGAVNLESLGDLYSNNKEVFSAAHLVNIDIKPNNNQFGTTNIIDTNASSTSEIIGQLLPALQLPCEKDIASNILSGIFSKTKGLSLPQVSADTYEVVAQMLRAGGQKPVFKDERRDIKQADTHIPKNPAQQSQPANDSFDLSSLFKSPAPSQPQPSPQAVVTSDKESEPLAMSQPEPSVEEVPVGEGVKSSTGEDDWLTPKIFKGSSIG